MFSNVTLSLLEGFLGTLKLFSLTLLFSLPLGLIISFGSMNKNLVVKLPIRFIIWVVRGTPLMLQLLIIFYGPGIFLGVNLWGAGDSGRFTAALVAFVINYACYFSEIYRGGIQSIPKGQYEAAAVLARVIAFYEIIWEGERFIKSAGIIWPLFYTGAFYLVFSGLLTLLFGYIEKKLDYFR